MIVSHKYKYLFVQYPHTGCTAIAKELMTNYEGEQILYKHAMYHQFIKRHEEHRDYFVFSTIRNPIDEIVSIYYKFKTNHEDYSNPENWMVNGGWFSERGRKQFTYIFENGATFENYLDKFFQLPYVNWTILDHHNFDFVMRFETLQQDFSQVLSKLGINQVRPIPIVNPTKKKDSSVILDSPQIQKKLIWAFGPIMNHLGYSFPIDWGPDQNISFTSQVGFQVNSLIRKFYWRNFIK